MSDNETVVLYGASDDLIEIDGILHEEFTYSSYDDLAFIGFSDGTILSIEYANDGCWRIHPVASGSALLDIVQAVSAEDDNYSDRATLTGAPGALRWAVVGYEWVGTK